MIGAMNWQKFLIERATQASAVINNRTKVGAGDKMLLWYWELLIASHIAATTCRAANQRPSEAGHDHRLRNASINEISRSVVWLFPPISLPNASAVSLQNRALFGSSDNTMHAPRLWYGPAWLGTFAPAPKYRFVIDWLNSRTTVSNLRTKADNKARKDQLKRGFFLIIIATFSAEMNPLITNQWTFLSISNYTPARWSLLKENKRPKHDLK